MKSKMLLLLIVVIFFITGCGNGSVKSSDASRSYIRYSEYDYRIAVDKDTCVEYLEGLHRFAPRFNADGTPVLDEECLNEQGK